MQTAGCPLRWTLAGGRRRRLPWPTERRRGGIVQAGYRMRSHAAAFRATLWAVNGTRLVLLMVGGAVAIVLVFQALNQWE